MVHRAAGWHCAIAYILWNHSSLRVSRRTDARPFRVYGVVRCRTAFFRHHEWSIANDWVKTHRRDRFDHRASGFIGLFLGSRRLGRAWRSRGSLWRSRRGAPRSLMSRWSRLTAQREAGAPDAKRSCAVQSTMYVSARTRKSVRARMRWGSAARPVRGQTLHLLATEFHMGKTGKKLIAKVEVGSAAVLPDSSPHERPDIVPTLQRAIFNSATFSSIATDAKGVIQIFNVGAERMLGYTAAEVTNKITPADLSDPLEVIARAKLLSMELATPIEPGFDALVFKASRGIEDIYELTYIRKDGSRLPAMVSVTALRDSHDTIIGYLLIGTDNTVRNRFESEQKRLDQRLRDQQFYTRSLIESNIDALIATDPSGIISDVNKQMEALTGCTRDELIGAPSKNYFTDAARAEAGIKRVLSETKLTDYELTARARDGKETVVSYNATTFYDRDRTLQGVFGSARDITERKILDQALQETNLALQGAKQAAEQANLAKSDFLSNMSHELRSPLNAILGFSQLMQSGMPAPTQVQRQSIEQILQAGWYLLELINEILDLALIESGKLSLSREPTSLADVLSDCRGMIEPLAMKCGIGLIFPLFGDTPFVKADRTRLKQVLINLLSNAIKYNRTGGTVEVICTMSATRLTRISVNDTGDGLTAEKLAQLFQPFNRLGQESGNEEGTGIGLVVSKRLIELMGGEIGVKSTVGTGSAFWIDLHAALAPRLIAGPTELKRS